MADMSCDGAVGVLVGNDLQFDIALMWGGCAALVTPGTFPEVAYGLQPCHNDNDSQ